MLLAIISQFINALNYCGYLDGYYLAMFVMCWCRYAIWGSHGQCAVMITTGVCGCIEDHLVTIFVLSIDTCSGWLAITDDLPSLQCSWNTTANDDVGPAAIWKCSLWQQLRLLSICPSILFVAYISLWYNGQHMNQYIRLIGISCWNKKNMVRMGQGLLL